jgi:hypothetical protein
MNNTGVTIIKTAGHDVDQATLQTALEHNKTCAGVSFPASDKHLVRVSIKQRGETTIQKLLDKYKDKTLVLFLGNGAEPIQEDDLQPYTILTNSDGKPILVAFLDGDFSEFAQPTSSFSPAYFAVRDHIVPQVQKLYDLVGHDITKLSLELEEPSNGRNMANLMLGDRGTITFLACNGDITLNTLKNDTTQEEFPWGWISNTYKSASATVETTEEDELANLMGESGAIPAVKESSKSSTPGRRPGERLSLPASKAADTQPLPTNQPEQPAPKPADTEPGKSAVPDVNLDESITIKVPMIRDHGKLSNWFRKRYPGGVLPQNYKDIKEITVKRSQATKAFLDDWLRDNHKSKTMATAVVKDFKDIKTVVENKPDASPAPEAPVTAPTAEPASEPKATPGTRRFGRPGSTAAPAAKVEKGYPEKTETTSPKDTTNKHINQPAPQVAAEFVSVIPTSQLKEIMATITSAGFKEALDRNAQAMKDPAKFREFEETIADFGKQLQLTSIEDTVNWPGEELLKIARNNVESMVIFGMSWRAKAMKMKEDLKAAEDLIAELSDKHVTNDKTAVEATVDKPVEKTGLTRRFGRPGSRAVA